jgi:hypothetical protein
MVGNLSTPQNDRMNYSVTIATLQNLMTSIVCIGVMATPAAAADVEAPATDRSIEALYEAGKAALSAKQPAEALGHFKSALARSDGRLAITWQMLLAVAVAYKDLGYPVHTLEYFKRFLTITAPHQNIASEKWMRRRATVGEQITELELALSMTYGFVMVESTPSGSKLFVAGHRAGADEDARTPFRLVLTPGAHVIRVEREGYKTGETRVELSAGAQKTLSVPLGLKEEQASPPAAPTTPKKAPPAAPQTADVTLIEAQPLKTPTASIAPWLLMGGGAAGAVAIAMSTLVTSESDALTKLETEGPPPQAEALSKAAEWRDHEANLATYEAVSIAMYAAAGAALASGLIWALLDDPTHNTQSNDSAVVLGVTPTQGGVYSHASWSF